MPAWVILVIFIVHVASHNMDNKQESLLANAERKLVSVSLTDLSAVTEKANPGLPGE